MTLYIVVVKGNRYYMNEFYKNFTSGDWVTNVNVQDFIQCNYTPYTGDESFLATATPRTNKLLTMFETLLKEERENNGVLAIDTSTIATITNHAAGYLCQEDELIVGLQTDAPLKRSINPFGGIKVCRKACEAYGVTFPDKINEEFKYHATHNDGVFSAYSEDVRMARTCGIITGLPDAYGRGRIIGDYRRVALYGVDRLIAQKKEDKNAIGMGDMASQEIRDSQELFEQIKALEDLKTMANSYGFDISLPAVNAQQAIQWLYFGYLGAIKEQNGAAMSLGRTSTFLDIYIQHDLDIGLITEETAQELMDQFVLKLRMARHLRTPEYNELFGGDPMWITEAIGGMGKDGRTLVTKSCYRFIHTLYNLKASAEPNMTVLWSQKLPDPWKRYVSKASCDTGAIQYENDDLMRPIYGDDYGIACCVSAMEIGKDMQFFGARANLPKLLLLALNGGIDEMKGKHLGPQMPVYDKDILDYDEIMERMVTYTAWLSKTYVNAMNTIHYMHDKYAYERLQFALHDSTIHRYMAFGIAGLSVLADSLSAIKYAKVTPIKNDEGIITDFSIEGEFPTFGNDDDRVDLLANEQAQLFIQALRKHPVYRSSEHTLSILTITSNVVYGKKTGSTPDGRKRGEPFAPGANPMHNREKSGAMASLNSVAKIQYENCKDGISNTFSIVPQALGKDNETRYKNLITIMDGYFVQGAHHLNVNVLNRETLIAAYENPEAYPNLTIRVSGYAVNFYKLSKGQQQEVIARTFHEAI